MKNWFTIEQIDRDTYAISEYSHWEETHCYLLLGRSSALLIDTGLGVGNIKSVVDELTFLPVTAVTAVTTHVHWDHIGGHGLFENIAVFRDEYKWLAGGFPMPLGAVKAGLTKEPHDFPPDFDPEKYRVFQGEPNIVFDDGYIFDLGGRLVTAIHTPGHSPGHCCFYENDRGYLYTGDLIYKGCLYAFYPTTDPVAFASSVKRVASLDIKKLLPAHHELNTPVSMVNEVDRAFDSLKNKGKLKQGQGVFDFGDFKIQI